MHHFSFFREVFSLHLVFSSLCVPGCGSLCTCCLGFSQLLQSASAAFIQIGKFSTLCSLLCYSRSFHLLKFSLYKMFALLLVPHKILTVCFCLFFLLWIGFSFTSVSVVTVTFLHHPRLILTLGSDSLSLLYIG